MAADFLDVVSELHVKFLEEELEAMAQYGKLLPRSCRACRKLQAHILGQAPDIAADFLDVVSNFV